MKKQPNNLSIKQFRILAIETSCDETSAAVLEVKFKTKKLKLKILSNIVSSQIKLHQKYHGVYPELASREHVKNILPVIQKALCYKVISHKKQLKTFNLKLTTDIDYIATTTGPGLIGSLLAGTITTKTLAYLFNKPVILVNHLEGHIYSAFIENNNIKFPLMCLIASGGHTSLIYMKNHLNYQIIGETLDDAAGEAYDKVASMLGLSYPGGPIIDKFAFQFQQAKRSNNFKPLFPRALNQKNNFNFSFSGLKTSVLYYLKKFKKPYSNKLIQKVSFEFQEAVTDSLVNKTLAVAKKYKVKSILVSGGVAANSRLREKFKLKIDSCKLKVDLHLPDRKLCTDNATMIAAAAAYKLLASKTNKWYDIVAQANSKLV